MRGVVGSLCAMESLRCQHVGLMHIFMAKGRSKSSKRHRSSGVSSLNRNVQDDVSGELLHAAPASSFPFIGTRLTPTFQLTCLCFLSPSQDPVPSCLRPFPNLRKKKKKKQPQKTTTTDTPTNSKLRCDFPSHRDFKTSGCVVFSSFCRTSPLASLRMDPGLRGVPS